MAAQKRMAAPKAKSSLLSPNAKGIALSAILFVIVSQVVNTAGAIATMGYYTDPAYFPLWSKVMMPGAGPPGPEFFALGILFSLATGLIFASSYSLLKASVPGAGIRKGLNFGLLLFLIAGVPFTLTTYLLLAVPPALLFSWAVEALITYAAGGAAFARLMPPDGRPIR